MITLGRLVKDVVSDFEGYAVGRAEYVYSETQILVSAKWSGLGEPISLWIPEKRLMEIE